MIPMPEAHDLKVNLMRQRAQEIPAEITRLQDELRQIADWLTKNDQPAASGPCRDEWQPPHGTGSQPEHCRTCSDASAPNPAYRVARCGQQSSHGPHVVEHGPDQPRNCPGTDREL